MTNNQPDHSFKIILVGEYYVGKTRFLKTLTNEHFEDRITIGVDFGFKLFNINNKLIKAMVWDTCSMEKFYSITKLYFRNSDAFLVCFDVTRKDTFIKAKQWIDDIRTEYENETIIIVGLKCDLDGRKVSTEEASQFAHGMNLKYYEASSLDQIQVTKIIQDTLMIIIQNKENSQPAQIDFEQSFHMEFDDDSDEYSLSSFS